MHPWFYSRLFHGVWLNGTYRHGRPSVVWAASVSTACVGSVPSECFTRREARLNCRLYARGSTTRSSRNSRYRGCSGVSSSSVNWTVRTKEFVSIQCTARKHRRTAKSEPKSAHSTIRLQASQGHSITSDEVPNHNTTLCDIDHRDRHQSNPSDNQAS